MLLDNHLQLIQKTVQRQGEHNASFFSDSFNIERLRLKYDQSEYDMLKRILQEGHDRGELVVPDINSTAYLLLKSFKSLEAPYINRYHHEYGKEDYLRTVSYTHLCPGDSGRSLSVPSPSSVTLKLCCIR